MYLRKEAKPEQEKSLQEKFDEIKPYIVEERPGTMAAILKLHFKQLGIRPLRKEEPESSSELDSDSDEEKEPEEKESEIEIELDSTEQKLIFDELRKNQNIKESQSNNESEGFNEEEGELKLITPKIGKYANIDKLISDLYAMRIEKKLPVEGSEIKHEITKKKKAQNKNQEDKQNNRDPETYYICFKKGNQFSCTYQGIEYNGTLPKRLRKARSLIKAKYIASHISNLRRPAYLKEKIELYTDFFPYHYHSFLFDLNQPITTSEKTFLSKLASKNRNDKQELNKLFAIIWNGTNACDDSDIIDELADKEQLSSSVENQLLNNANNLIKRYSQFRTTEKKGEAKNIVGSVEIQSNLSSEKDKKENKDKLSLITNDDFKKMDKTLSTLIIGYANPKRLSRTTRQEYKPALLHAIDSRKIAVEDKDKIKELDKLIGSIAVQYLTLRDPGLYSCIGKACFTYAELMAQAIDDKNHDKATTTQVMLDTLIKRLRDHSKNINHQERKELVNHLLYSILEGVEKTLLPAQSIHDVSHKANLDDLDDRINRIAFLRDIRDELLDSLTPRTLRIEKKKENLTPVNEFEIVVVTEGSECTVHWKEDTQIKSKVIKLEDAKALNRVIENPADSPIIANDRKEHAKISDNDKDKAIMELSDKCGFTYCPPQGNQIVPDVRLAQTRHLMVALGATHTMTHEPLTHEKLDKTFDRITDALDKTPPKIGGRKNAVYAAWILAAVVGAAVLIAAPYVFATVLIAAGISYAALTALTGTAALGATTSAVGVLSPMAGAYVKKKFDTQKTHHSVVTQGLLAVKKAVAKKIPKNISLSSSTGYTATDAVTEAVSPKRKP